MELVVVVGVIGILSGIGFWSFRTIQDSVKLDQAAHRVMQDIRLAMNYALQARQEDPCDATSEGLSGFGIYFDASTPDEYRVFANCNGIDKEGYRTGARQDEYLEIFSLGSSVQIQSVQGEPEAGTWGGGGPTNHWSVAFFPPDPQIALCRRQSAATNSDDGCGDAMPSPLRLKKAWIVLGLTNDPNNTRTITVTNKGVVEIQ